MSTTAGDRPRALATAGGARTETLDAPPAAPPVRPSPPRSPVPTREPAPSTPPRPAPPAEPEAGTSWLLPLVVLVIGMFMSVLDTSIVNVALPTVQTDLGIGASDGQWVSTAYSLAEGVMVPISAWLGYRFGYKRMYVLSLAGFTVASALCGLATGLVPLVAFRILQAIPGGVIPVICMVMLRRMVPPERLGAAMGLFGLGIVVAPATGPTLGGFLVEYVDWRWIFFVNIPIGVLGVVAAMVVLRESPTHRDRPLDVLGFVTVAGGLFALLLALEEGRDWGWTSYRILILFTAAALLLALFVVVELEVDKPLLDLRLFARGQFVVALVLVSVISISLFASFFFVPQFLQSTVRGMTPVNTGIALIPQAIVLAVLIPLSGLLYDRIGARWLAVLAMHPRRPAHRRHRPGRGRPLGPAGGVRSHRPAHRRDAGQRRGRPAGALPADGRRRPDRRLQPGVLRRRLPRPGRCRPRPVPEARQARTGLRRGRALARFGVGQPPSARASVVAITLPRRVSRSSPSARRSATGPASRA